MSYPVNYPTPQGANVQIFNGGGTSPNGGGTSVTTTDWVKPQGASFVWFTLIGAGGGGGNTDGVSGAGSGGGSGAVTNCMIPAFLIPDSLRVSVGNGGAAGDLSSINGANGTATSIIYQQKDTTGYTLLAANAGGGGAGGVNGGTSGAAGTASTSNYFSCAGFFQSIAGQTGIAGINGASTTTFLGGGSGTGQLTANYGYTSGNGSTSHAGYFQMQPIIVGIGGGASASTNQGSIGGIGCGGGGASLTLAIPAAGANGGNGLAVIISW